MKWLGMVWGSCLSYSFNKPHNFIEILMLGLGILLLLLWGITTAKPYLILSLSYAIGASVSILGRSCYFEKSQKLASRGAAVLSISLSIFSLAIAAVGYHL